jgi:hypothetical protein
MIDIDKTLTVNDVRAMQRRLKEIEPGLRKSLIKELKAIAKPVQDQIKRNIPSIAPMSGMKHVVKYKDGSYAVNEGRLRWDGQGTNPSSGKMVKKYAANKTSISTAAKANGKSLTTPLVKVTMQSAAASMVDMAGRVNQGRRITREYTIRLRNGEIQKRRHRVTTQGQQFMSNLQGRASRYGWAALENKIVAVEREVEAVLKKYYDIANRGV